MLRNLVGGVLLILMMDDKFKEKFPANKCKIKKTILVFDENARREFLTGFHRRKLKRKTKAAEELKKQMKLEKKKIKAKTKEMYKKLIRCQKPVPEVEHLLTEEIDMGTHSISVTEISPTALAHKYNCIGINQVHYENNETQEEKKNYNCINSDLIQGMDTISKPKKNKLENEIKLKNKKDFKKIIKKEATNHMKNSKIFKAKSKKAQMKNTKIQQREEKRRRKFNNKHKKIKHKN